MSKKKDSLILYESFFEATADLSAESIAELWHALGNYLKDDITKITNVIPQTTEAKLAWKFIKLQLDADKKRWLNTCDKRAEAGRVGMAKRWGDSDDKRDTENEATITNDNKNNKRVTKITNVTDTDTESDTDVIINNNNKANKSPDFDFISILPEAFAKSVQFKEAWETWLTYRRERKLSKWTPTTLRKKAKEFAEWGVEATIANIDNAIANGWQGVFKAREGNKPAIDAYALQRAFEWLESHMLGDYPETDPQGEEGLRRWADTNGIIPRLQNPLDKLYKHVYKTGR